MLGEEVVQFALLDVEDLGKALRLGEVGDDIVELATLQWCHRSQRELVDADERLDNHPDIGVALSLGFHFKTVDVVHALHGVLQETAYRTHGHIDHHVFGGNIAVSGRDEDVTADSLRVFGDVCQGLFVHFIEMGKERAEEEVLLTDEVQQLVFAVDAVVLHLCQEIAIAFQDGCLVTDADGDTVQGSEEWLGSLDGFQKFLIFFVGAGLLLQEQYIAIAISPGLCEAKHLSADGVMADKVVAGFVVVFGEDGVLGKIAIHRIIQLLPLAKHRTESCSVGAVGLADFHEVVFIDLQGIFPGLEVKGVFSAT